MAVYFLQADSDGPVKIGWAANNVNGRIKQFQTGHFMDLRLIREIPEADRLDEAALHRFFSQERIRGEWFQYSDAMLSVTLDDARARRMPKREPEAYEAAILRGMRSLRLGMENEAIRGARKAAGLTQAQLAELVGVGQPFVAQIEVGTRPLPADILARMPSAIRDPLVRARIKELQKLITTDHLGRDEKDFAIEHAGYLADSVEKLLSVDKRIAAFQWLELNKRLYEFRKRRARIAELEKLL
jgi:transcriptional regulator with XRE-family HTH domain